MPFDGTTFLHHHTLAPKPVAARRISPVAARLRYARNMIAAGRWCQKQERDNHGNRCLIGWARHTEDNPMTPTSTYTILKLWHALPPSARSSPHFQFSDVARYNDTHTRNTVIRLLNRAIVAMETR